MFAGDTRGESDFVINRWSSRYWTAPSQALIVLPLKLRLR